MSNFFQYMFSANDKPTTSLEKEVLDETAPKTAKDAIVEAFEEEEEKQRQREEEETKNKSAMESTEQQEDAP